MYIYAFKEKSRTIFIGVRLHCPVLFTVHGCIIFNHKICTSDVAAVRLLSDKCVQLVSAQLVMLKCPLK